MRPLIALAWLALFWLACIALLQAMGVPGWVTRAVLALGGLTVLMGYFSGR